MSVLVGAAVIAALCLPALWIAWITASGLRESWRGWRAEQSARDLSLRVIVRQDLDEATFRIVLAREGLRWPVPAFQPGQHIVLRVPADGARLSARAYSLARWTRHPASYELAIKRESEGHVSCWLHAHAQPGFSLQVSRPKGEFHAALAADAAEIVLVAGGIGITPMRAMLHAWCKASRPPRVTLHYSARLAAQLHFHDEFVAMSASHPWFLYKPRLTQPAPGWAFDTGRLTAAAIRADLAEARSTTVFLCANKAMEDAIVYGLCELGCDPVRIHREAFGIEAKANDIQAEVTFRGRTFAYDGAPTLLHALTAQGYDIPAECRAGECGLCRLKIARGEGRHVVTGAGTGESLLACCAVPAGDIELAG